MDPLTALGLGANILQLIDFGTKIVKTTREVLRSGNTSDNDFYLTIAADLRLVVSDLLRSTSKPASDPASDALVKLARDCEAEAESLIRKANSFVSKSDKRASLAAVRSVAQLIWNKSELDALDQRLAVYRDQLNLRILAAVNRETATQSSKIVEILSLTQSINSCVKTVAAVLRDDQGTHRTLLNSNYSPVDHDSAEATSITYGASSQAFSSDSKDDRTNTAARTEVQFRRSSQMILDSLWFRFATTRENVVHPAFQTTYEWAMDGYDQRKQRKWSDLREWLRAGQGCYWINGKAGSGKSTLMKFISKHRSLDEQLGCWCPKPKLLKASFFFWRAGQHPLQKTQDGLLRSLLFQILDRRRELLTICFPELCRHLTQTSAMFKSLEHSPEDLRLAFLRLVKHDLSSGKLFFLIDGLDEYEGDYRQLVDLISQAANSPNIKLLVSSRPIPLIVQAFMRCPSLRLQDLTYGDIAHYARAKLQHDSALKSMDRIDYGFADLLIDSIASKASGVFLWVIIVVRETLDGLANHDTAKQLLETLDKLPSDLEELYAFMFDSMTDAYKAEASLIFQLHMCSREIQQHYPLTALQLYFAAIRDPQQCYKGTPQLLSSEELEAYVNIIEGRLRSRCCGLLETQEINHDIIHVYQHSVEFLHRTVHEFLQQENVWAKLTSWIPGEPPLYQRLVASCIEELRHEPISSSQVAPGHTPPTLDRQLLFSDARIAQSFDYCWEIRKDGKNTAMPYLGELFRVYHSSPLLTEFEERQLLQQRSRVSLVTMNLPAEPAPGGFLTCAATYGLVEAFDKTMSNMLGDPLIGSPALMTTLLNLAFPQEFVSREMLYSSVLGLLTLKIDPNISVVIARGAASDQLPRLFESVGFRSTSEGHVDFSQTKDSAISPWILWLLFCRIKIGSVRDDPVTHLNILEQMILAGGDLNVFVSFGIDLTSSELISRILSRLQTGDGTEDPNITIWRKRVRDAMKCSIKTASASSKPTKEQHSLALGLRNRLKNTFKFS